MKKNIFVLLLVGFSLHLFAQQKDTLFFSDSSSIKTKKTSRFKHHFGATLSIYNNMLYINKDLHYTKSSPLQTGQTFALFYEIAYKKRFSTELGMRIYSASKNAISFTTDTLRFDVNMNTAIMYDIYIYEKYYINKTFKNTFVGFGISYSEINFYWDGTMFNHNKPLTTIGSNYNSNNYVTNISLVIGKEFAIKKMLFDFRLSYNHPVYFQNNKPPKFDYTEGLSTTFANLYGTQNILYRYDNIQFGISFKL